MGIAYDPGDWRRSSKKKEPVGLVRCDCGVRVFASRLKEHKQEECSKRLARKYKRPPTDESELPVPAQKDLVTLKAAVLERKINGSSEEEILDFLRFECDLTYKEIATVLDMKFNTAKTKCFRMYRRRYPIQRTEK